MNTPTPAPRAPLVVPAALAGKLLVLNGPPCCGKGSIAQRLAAKYGCVHLSTGDIFRDHVERNTELGKQVRVYLDENTYVPDDLAINFIFDRVSQPDCMARGACLDGFPRTAAQAAALASSRITVDRVVNIQCPDAVLVDRAKGRRIDAATKTIYHTEYAPAPSPDVEARLVTRNLDNNIQQRLDVHHAQHRRFKMDGAINVNGNKQLAHVFADVCRIVEQDHENAAAVSTATTMTTTTTTTASAENTCTICLDEPANFLVTPCGHQCGCEGCLTRIQRNGGGRCPVCRGSIATIQRVFATAGTGAGAATTTTETTETTETHTATEPRGIPDMVPAAATTLFESAAATTTAIAVEDEWPEDAPDADTDDEGTCLDDPARGDGDGSGTNSASNAAAAHPSGIKVRVAPVHDICPGTTTNVVVEITTPEQDQERAPVDICAVIDVSGSMCSAAAVENEDGTKTDDGLSVLDLVKHSVRAVINCLGPNDRLSIVPFSNAASIHYPLTHMTAEGIAGASAALAELQPSGSTNLWAGLKTGMDSLMPATTAPTSSPPRKAIVMLLTDGCPNCAPPAGHIQELKNYRDRTDFSVQINTFGFGYNLDSKLLHELAVEGAGTYAFIPDAKIVGTTFVNSVANVLSTLAHSTTLHLTEKNGATFAGACYGGNAASTEDWGVVLSLGPLSYGQTRYISVPMTIPAPPAPPAVTGGDNGGGSNATHTPKDAKPAAPYLQVVLELNGTGTTRSITRCGVARGACACLLAGHLTAKTVTVGLQAIADADSGKGQNAVKSMQLLSLEVSKGADQALTAATDDWAEMSANDRVVALSKDVAGRMSKAFQGQPRFSRWGKHYLRALVRAHQLNLCTNFMDTGLQVNGGALFRSLRARGDEVFVNLPAPTPSRLRPAPVAQSAHSLSRSQTPSRTAASAVNMSTYYAGSGGGCFGPDSTVEVLAAVSNNTVTTNVGTTTATTPTTNTNTTTATATTTTTAVSAIKAGDTLLTASGTGTVTCVVKIARDANTRMIALPGGLTITGGHPIRRGGKWCLPRDQDDAHHTAGEGHVYTFVLSSDSDHVLLVNGTECITWGHGITDDGVAHAFFGAHDVIAALEALPNYKNGAVEVHGLARDAGGTVIGFCNEA